MTGSIELMRKHLKPEFKQHYLQALRQAHEKLRTRKEGVYGSPYICDAIGGYFSSPAGVNYDLTGWVSAMLGRHFSLEGWLVKHGHLPWADSVDTPRASVTEPEYKPRVQATRLAWLQWMIQHVEEHL